METKFFGKIRKSSKTSMAITIPPEIIKAGSYQLGDLVEIIVSHVDVKSTLETP